MRWRGGCLVRWKEALWKTRELNIMRSHARATDPSDTLHPNKQAETSPSPSPLAKSKPYPQTENRKPKSEK